MMTLVRLVTGCPIVDIFVFRRTMIHHGDTEDTEKLLGIFLKVVRDRFAELETTSHLINDFGLYQGTIFSRAERRPTGVRASAPAKTDLQGLKPEA
jgi:hypothetical protein